MNCRLAKKSIVLIVSILLTVVLTVGGTVAYIFMHTDSVENTFTPAHVSCAVVENGVDYTSDTLSVAEKGTVQIKNTGDTEAYIRAAIVINWKNANGDVYYTAPASSDYTLNLGSDKWQLGADGYYYYTSPVPAGANQLTDPLIASCTVSSNAAVPDGFYLSVEIVASAIQSQPAQVVTQEWSSGVASVGSNQTLSIKQEAGGLSE